jgi:hypothetical protein
MSGNYKVRQGDHVSAIASAFGFSSYQTIWNHPNNAKLKQQRVSPNVLFPGDTLFIPDKSEAEYQRPTDAKHKFTLQQQKLQLRLVLEDLYEKPIAGAPCILNLAGDVRNVKTDASGRLVQDIPPDVHDAVLIIQDQQTPLAGVPIPIKIGDLDPVEEITGQQARLNNLGYFPGKTGGTDLDALESAIEEFQCDHGLTVDGICGPQTQTKLKQVHGC